MTLRRAKEKNTYMRACDMVVAGKECVSQFASALRRRRGGAE